MCRHKLLACAAAFLVAMVAPASGSSTATLRMDSPTYLGQIAHVPVSLEFGGDAEDTIELFDLSVTESDAALEGRFSFVLDPSLSGWSEFNPLSDDGIGSYESSWSDPLTFLGPGRHVLGTLRVTLAGLSVGDAYQIVPDGLAWPTTFTGTDGQTLAIAQYDTTGTKLPLLLVPPDGVSVTVPAADVIPEPLTLTTIPAALCALAGYVLRRSGRREDTEPGSCLARED